MKTFVRLSFLLIGLMLLPLFLFSQGGGIFSLSVIPANPNPEDSVSVIADVWLSSGSCWLDNHNGSISQDTMVEINGTFNSGMLTVICYTSDTFQLGRLEPGNYHVTYNMHFVNFPSQLDTELLTFTVGGGTTYVLPVSHERRQLSAFLYPASQQVQLSFDPGPGETVNLIRVYALDGRLVQTLVPGRNSGSVITLPVPGGSGLYLYSLESSENHRYSCKLAIP